MSKVTLAYMYRDAGNYKKFPEPVEVDTDLYPQILELKEGDDFEMGQFGTPTAKEFYQEYGYDQELDHNILDVISISQN